MILDNLLMFTGTSNGTTGGIAASANTDAPTSAGAQSSTNVIDLHISGLPVLGSLQGARDMGIGDDPALKLLIQVTTTFSGGNAITVALQGAPDAGNGTPGTFASYWTSPAYTEAQLVAGARLYDMDMPRPPQGQPIPRYLRLSYTNSGTHGAGALEGCIVLDRHDQVYSGTSNATLGGYPAGITVAN